MAARTRAGHGRAAVGALYAALGARIFDTAADSDQPEIRQETDEALALTGKDVVLRPRDLAACLVRPKPSRCGTTCWAWPVSPASPSSSGACGSGRSFGVETGQAGVQEDWYAGRRRARE